MNRPLQPLSRRRLVIFEAALLGVVAGYASVALAPTGWVLVGLLSVLLIIAWARRQLLGLGTFVALLGASALALLIPNVIGSQACPVGPGGVVEGSGGLLPRHAQVLVTRRRRQPRWLYSA